MKLITYKNLYEFTNHVLKEVGLDTFSADAVSRGLCSSSLRGIDSHGIRLLSHYVNSAISGRKNPKPNIKIQNIFPAYSIIDADNAFGHAAGRKAIIETNKLAERFGIGACAVFNSSHPGAMSSIVIEGATNGFIQFGCTHADALMLSHGGTRPFFGTNPICFAIPMEGEEPFCLDMATTQISWNELLSYRQKGEMLSSNLAADINGNLTNNTFDAVSLIPAGGYKGFGLAAIVDIFCGVLTGMSYGRNIKSMFKYDITKKRKLGQFYFAFRTDAVIEQSEFLKSMKNFTNSIRSEPAKGSDCVMAPNDPQKIEEAKRTEIGIPLDNCYEELIKLSEIYNVRLKLK